MRYIFREYNEINDEKSYDISGSDYAKLIRYCATHASYFSLRKMHETTPVCALLNQYTICPPPSCLETEPLYVYVYPNDNGAPPPFQPYDIFYRVCFESVSILIDKISSVFSYLWDEQHFNPPENLTFYRLDGSVLFSSVTHDGICWLTPKEYEEKPNSILSEHWEINDL